MKTALWGAWHVHADGYLRTAVSLSEVVGVYEDNAEWKNALAAKYNVKAFDSAEELLASDAEAVLVCTESSAHADTIIRIAEAGKHIFTEKVMTLTNTDAQRVKDAIVKNGVRFVISFPQKYFASHQTVKSIVDLGEIGKINYLRFRNCHSGSSDAWLPAHFYDGNACGGGAMIDLGAHGMYLTDWFLGLPDGYRSSFTLACPGGLNAAGLEDNAVTVMTYKDGAIAVNETGFVSVGCPASLEVGGMDGYITCSENKVIKRTRATENKPVEVPLAEALPSPLEQFLTGNILPGCGIEEALHLTEMMVGAYANR